MLRISLPANLVWRLTFIVICIGVIFAVDTVTRYEVAVAVFYTLVILTAAPALGRLALVSIALSCIIMTVLSMACTPHGDFRIGLINTGISIAAISITTYLVVKMEAARKAAHTAQVQLMRIARVKSLEGLTTSIAHEINQPLAAIVTSGNACQRWLEQEPTNLDRARQALERIVSDADRASTIIARLRSLTRGEPPHKSKFDFNKAIINVVELSRAEIARNNIRLITNLNSVLPSALADCVQIQQVVGNLLLNAIEAIAATSIQDRYIRITSEARDDKIVFSIFDNGDGIASEVQGHLFEAFWTTKNEGLGVGLSISRAIIESNGGQIWSDNNKGRGAVFRFSLPSASQDDHQ